MWWLLLRNHPPGTTLSPVPAATPPPSGSFVHATSWGGTLLVAIFGAALLLIAPWLTRGVVTAGCWLARSLLGPGTLTQRVRDLEQARARGVDDLAALLRQVERDLHDGAQVRLAAMAMNLGMAKEKLGADGQAADGRAPDVERARELVGAAHLGAKEALVELRELVRGIHPPVLEVGLAEALATLAAGSAIPVRVTACSPGPADAGHRGHRLLLRGRTAGQRGQAQRRGQDRHTCGYHRFRTGAGAPRRRLRRRPGRRRSCRGQRPARARPARGHRGRAAHRRAAMQAQIRIGQNRKLVPFDVPGVGTLP